MFALSSESFPLALRMKTLDQVGSSVPDTLWTWVHIPCTVDRKEMTEGCHKERTRTGSVLGPCPGIFFTNLTTKSQCAASSSFSGLLNYLLWIIRNLEVFP